MPRLLKSFPSYRRHSDGKFAIVQLSGKIYFLGKYGSPESRAEYDRLIAIWIRNNRQMPDEEQVLSLNELAVGYLRHAQSYYCKNGRVTREYGLIKEAITVLVGIFGDIPVLEFGPKKLKQVRDAMILKQWSRKYINKQVGRIIRCFKWGVEEELVPETVQRALTTVAGLKKNRSAAVERPRVLPVEQDVVKATLKELSQVVADMIRFQLATACRPGEVCMMQVSQIDRQEEVWIYTPAEHKMNHFDELDRRQIYIGPRAIKIIEPYLENPSGPYVFSPQASVLELQKQRSSSRVTPLKYGNRPGTNKKRRPKRLPANHYTTASYRRAIHRGCDRAFLPPEELDEEELRAWRSKHRWSPNQLRHLRATLVRKTFGLEAAQVVLGHSSAEVTQIYAERNEQLAINVMKQTG